MRDGSNTPGGPPPPYPAPPSGGARPPGVRPEPPAPVRIAYEIWCAVALLGIATTVGVVLVMSSLQDTLVSDLLERFSDGVGGQPVTREDVVSSFHLSLGVIAVLGAVVIAVTFLLARAMLKGRSWARAVLVGFTAVLAVLGFEGLMGFDGDGAGAMVLEIATILQAVLAIGASVIAHRGEANAYFYGRRGR